MNARQIWQATLAELQLQVSKANYDTWLRHTRVISNRGDAFVVGVPNAFAREWIESRYISEITRTLARLAGGPVEVQFAVAPPTRQSRAKTQPSSFSPDDNGHRRDESDDSAPLTLTSVAAPPEVAPDPPPAAEPPSARVSTPANIIASEDDWTPNPRYTFARFVVGPCNALAHAAAWAASDRPGEVYNPLFIYGGVGLGKTHLMHAVAHVAVDRGLKVVYAPAEQFMNEMINAIQTGRTLEFRQHYRHADVLLIDDIQFIIGKPRTQIEFFHTFNAIYSSNKQIVISSDQSAKAMGDLEPRMRSRFEGGLVVDVQPPELETRIAILELECEYRGIQVSRKVLEMLAQKFQKNVRDLAGALTRAVAYAGVKKLPLTVDLANQAVDELVNHPARRFITASLVVETVARFYGLDPRAIKGQQRDKHVSQPRQVAMYLMREEAGLKQTEIGRELGGRDHSTVLHGFDKVKAQIESDNRLRQEVLVIRDRLYDAAKP